MTRPKRKIAELAAYDLASGEGDLTGCFWAGLIERVSSPLVPSPKTLDFSRPGKPTDNAYAESFNARIRAECPNQAWFLDLDDACRKVEHWRVEYNEVRPHSAIGDSPPMALLRKAIGQSEAAAEPGTLT